MSWCGLRRRIVLASGSSALGAGAAGDERLPADDVLEDVIAADVTRSVVGQIEPLTDSLPGPPSRQVLQLDRGARARVRTPCVGRVSSLTRSDSSARRICQANASWKSAPEWNTAALNLRRLINLGLDRQAGRGDEGSSPGALSTEQAQVQ